MSDEKDALERLAREKKDLLRHKGELLRRYGDERAIPEEQRRALQSQENSIDREATKRIKRAQDTAERAGLPEQES